MKNSDTAANRVAFNINSCVRVRLTDEGRAWRAADHAKFWDERGLKVTYSAPKEDADGWSEWPMWILMETFGKHMVAGGVNPFSTEIELYTKDLTPVTATPPAEPT